MNDNSITIIGAGLVGSLAAVFFAKRGFCVQVFERRSDLRLKSTSGGRSINLALANRGIIPLEQAGLMGAVSALLTPMKGRMIHDLQGELNFQPYGQKPEEVIYSVSRTDLNSLCLTAAQAHPQVTIDFNCRCVGVDLENQHLILKNELTGQVFEKSFRRVLGTDGSASALREAIHALDSESLCTEPLGHSYKELHIPATAQGSFQMDPHALHIWPRGNYMLIALPNKDNSFTATLFMPNEGDISFASIDNEQKLLAFFQQQFPDTRHLIPALSKDFFENPTGQLATVRCNPWHYQDKALLLGDAAHAIVPFHGQGMNCGFEDVSELDTQVALYPNDWQTIFAETARLRQPNANAIADMAIENYLTMRASVQEEKFLLKNTLGFELERRFPDFFCPRYSMVMFHRLPYAEAKERGQIQNEILNLLTESIDTLTQVDYHKAKQLIEQRLKPLTLNPH